MARNDHIDPAVEEEYRLARESLAVAKKRMAAAAVARERAHIAAEVAASQSAQRLAGLSDAEWDALRQRIREAHGTPSVSVTTPGVGE